jgi:hypothetical protein
MDKQPKRKKNETLPEKARRHLMDKNDIIPDEDIRSVKVGEISGKEEEKSKEFADEFTKKKKITPWNILDEEE